MLPVEKLGLKLISKEEQAEILNRKQKRRPSSTPRLPPRGGPRQRIDCRSDDSSQAANQQAGSSSAYAQQQEEQQQAWQARRPQNRAALQWYEAEASERDKKQQAADVQSRAIRSIAAAAASHPCCACERSSQQQLDLEQQLHECLQGQLLSPPAAPQSAAGSEGAAAAGLIIKRSRTVAAHALGASVHLPLPTLQCTACRQDWEVAPGAFGFFSATPAVPCTLFAVQLLEVYTSLAHSCGTSTVAFAGALEAAAASLHPNQVPSLALDKRALANAWQEWTAAAVDLSGCDALAAQLGPTGMCAACAVPPPTAAGERSDDEAAPVLQHTAAALLSADLRGRAKAHGLLPGAVSLTGRGADGRLRVHAVCADAMVKPNRYSHAGKSSGRGALVGAAYLGAPRRQLWQLKRAGALPISSACGSSQQAAPAAAAAAAAAAGGDELEVSCHPSLSCYRESSRDSSISDEQGLAGLVCPHGFPLLGCMLVMCAPERTLYYDLLLTHLLNQADVRTLYIDIGCMYAAHWRRHLPGRRGPEQIKLPWWHAIGHRAACYLLHSALYSPGAGRRIGEQCERLWAQLKPISRLTRFMSKLHYLTTFEAAFRGIASQRQASMPAFMEQQHKLACKKLADCQAFTQALLATAADKGSSAEGLVTEAIQSMEAGMPSGSDLPDKQTELLAEYVRICLEESALEQLGTQRHAILVALPGRNSSMFAARSGDRSHREHLSKRKAQVLTRLNCSDVHGPAPDSEAYSRGHAHLRDQALLTAQRQIEQEVAALQAIAEELKDATYQQRATKQKRKDARKKRVRQLAADMGVLQKLELPFSDVVAALPAEWNAAVYEQLYKGNFPWRAASPSRVGPVLVARFRDACAEEARTLEELQLQRLERGRVVRYYRRVHAGRTQQAAAHQRARLRTGPAAQRAHRS